MTRVRLGSLLPGRHFVTGLTEREGVVLAKATHPGKGIAVHLEGTDRLPEGEFCLSPEVLVIPTDFRVQLPRPRKHEPPSEVMEHTLHRPRGREEVA